MSATLDLEKFRKVRALMESGATDGERAAARSRAEAIARKAGMTLQEAIDYCQPPIKQTFTGFDDWMEDREPGYKARRAAERAEKERKDEIRRREILREYGSKAALFRRTPWEKALFQAVEPIATLGYGTDMDGARYIYTQKIDGKVFDFPKYEEITPPIMKVILAAYPVPATLMDILGEHRSWRRLELDRALFNVGEWNHYQEVNIRIAILEHELYQRPIQGWQDMQARMEWWQIELDWEINNLPIHEQGFKDRIVADLEILKKMPAGPYRRLPRPSKHQPPNPIQGELFS